MTKKQNQILEAALHLFSEEGYHATSTSRVAKIAGVSEGLIFRHFKNKESLLEVIITEIKQKVNTLFTSIINEEDPKEIIRKTLEAPFNITESELKYWKLIFKLKWEVEHIKIETFEPLKSIISKTFMTLRYKNPELETEFLIQHLNGLTSSIIKNSIEHKKSEKEFLLRKYHL